MMPSLMKSRNWQALSVDGFGTHQLGHADSCVIPDNVGYSLDLAAKSEVLEVSLPATLGH